MRYSHITTLNDREAIFFEYLNKKMQKENRDYVNTNYGYVKNVAGYKNIPGARYLVKNLAKKKLITVQEGTNYKGRQYLRIKIAKPIVVKRLLILLFEVFFFNNFNIIHRSKIAFFDDSSNHFYLFVRDNVLF